MLDPLLPVAIILSSFVTGILIFFLHEEQHRLRTVLNLVGAVAKLTLVAVMFWGVLHEHRYAIRFPLLPGIDLAFDVGALAMLFVMLSAVLWLVTTVYAVGYLEGSPHRSRFFGFFSLCVTSTMGIAMAGNLLTFLMFYELLTLSTYPLIVHRGTTAALRAGNVYLRYTIGGGAVLLIGAAWLFSIAGNLEFTEGGAVAHLAREHRPALIAIFMLLIAGLGVKTALVPLHAWLPSAMVAPAPVSALLHAVAVVKAGAFGVVRVIYEVYGVTFAADLGVLAPLSWLAGATILYGSLRALAQDDFKRRLAYSTVSQVSYIVLGVSVFGPLASIGGVVHLVHQGIMKITMFFCAGNIAETLGLHKVSELNGIGRRMPWTMTAFTVAAFGMIGVPPLAGAVTKWYLGLGALAADTDWVLWVLAASSLLNALYFLPIVYRAWFLPLADGQPPPRPHEAKPMLLIPTLATALFTIAAGLLAPGQFSPLSWVKLIAEREFVP